jgi:signal transduction histidine kinase
MSALLAVVACTAIALAAAVLDRVGDDVAGRLRDPQRVGGTIEIRTRTVGDRVRVEVADGGPGLPASVAELARRPRAGRGRRGRGLAIAASVLHHCGGRIAAVPSAGGGRVAIELPAAPARP